MPDDKTLALLRQIMGDLPVVRFTNREAETPEESAAWEQAGVIVNPPDLGAALEAAFTDHESAKKPDVA